MLLRVSGLALLGAFGASAAVLLVPSAASQDKPDVVGIHAEFVESERATFYSITVKSVPEAVTAKPTYAWSLAPPADDATCKVFAQTDLDPSRAVWRHGAEDGCKHEGTQHNGTITAVVTILPFTCTTRYVGSLTGDGSPADCQGSLPTTTTPTVPPAKPVAPIDSASETEVAKAAAAKAYKEFLDDAENGGLLSVGGKLLKENPKFKKTLGLIKEKTGAVGKAVDTVVTIVADATSTTFYVGAYVEFLLAQDPPRRDYAVPTAVIVPPGYRIKPGLGVPSPLSTALNALLANSANLVGTSKAFIQAFERAQGAVKAKDSAAESEQAAAAAGYAIQEASLFEQRGGLRAKLARALRAAGYSFVFAPGDVAGLVQQVAREGLPKTFGSSLQRFGLTKAEVAAARARVAREIAGARGSLKVPDFITGANVTAAEKAAAQSLRRLAARLRAVAAATRP